MHQPQPDSNEAAGPATRRRWPGVLFLAALTGLAGCTIAMPFQYVDPALQAERGSQNVVVSLTMTDYEPGWTARRVFWRHVGRVEQSLANRPGLVGYALRRQIIGNRAWTMTVWKDDSSLEAFVRSPAHQEAIRQALPMLETVRFARIELRASEIPITWTQAEQLLEASENGYQELSSSHQKRSQ